MKNTVRVAIILWAVAVAALFVLCVTVSSAEEPAQEPAPAPVATRSADAESTITPAEKTPAKVVYSAEEIILAKTVWGEARGCSRTEQAAVVWCILNRVDAGMGSIIDVATAPLQFVGYREENPVTEEHIALVNDVLTRRALEDTNSGEVGRVLPKEYLYFTGDGVSNHFCTEFNGGTVWDWSLQTPYEEDFR